VLTRTLAKLWIQATGSQEEALTWVMAAQLLKFCPLWALSQCHRQHLTL
jgi:hypothetical protein